ncbi:MAG: ABC transporter permease [Oscillospiraceae bacterium]|nr:ABC transporter permease [Oscillospiraceae bacterium]
MLIKRNLLIFFRDKAAVFFSLLAVLIILLLYVLFLGSTMEEALSSQLGFESDKIPAVMASIVFSGLIAVASITSSMGALQTTVTDKERAYKDFLTSPASSGKITLSYILSSTIIGLIMTFISLILCVAYIAFRGGNLPGFTDCLLLFLTTLLSVLCGNSIVFFITAFIKSGGAFTAMSTVLGTMVGFLMGVYIPIGQLPSSVQWVIKCFPMSHAAAMFKQVLADGELSELFANAPPQVLGELRETFGVVFTYGNYTSGFWFSALVLGSTAALFYGASILVVRD